LYQLPLFLSGDLRTLFYTVHIFRLLVPIIVFPHLISRNIF
jgi:hypothetical protein